jgi:hypothetical protein
LTVSEVLKTRFVRVRLEQGASEKGRLIVEFGDPVTRDALLSAIREAAQDD